MIVVDGPLNWSSKDDPQMTPKPEIAEIFILPKIGGEISILGPKTCARAPEMV